MTESITLSLTVTHFKSHNSLSGDIDGSAVFRMHSDRQFGGTKLASQAKACATCDHSFCLTTNSGTRDILPWSTVSFTAHHCLSCHDVGMVIAVAPTRPFFAPSSYPHGPQRWFATNVASQRFSAAGVATYTGDSALSIQNQKKVYCMEYQNVGFLR